MRQKPSEGKLQVQIEKTFGSVDALKEKLTALFDVIDWKAVERNYGGVAG